MYDLHSCESIDTNIICIVSDCGMGERWHWPMSPLALPCECVPIDTVMKEGKGELKHFKNLMKEHEMCTIKCANEICHNDHSCMLI